MEKIDILNKLEYITEKLETLNLAIIDYEKETKKFEKYKALKTIERDCEKIIESTIKINQELLSQKLINRKTYRESFEKLKEINLDLNEEIIHKLSNTT